MKTSPLVACVVALLACRTRVADSIDPVQPPTPAPTTSAPSISSAPAAVQTWVREHAIPLRTVEAGHGLDDMEPLRAVVADARVVALGESTHGTREHFQLKHRMLEFLVTQMGFTLFGIEATMPEAVAIDDYVVHGTGDPRKALAQLHFWTWDTEEVLAMIEWMRQYNADPANTKKIRFFGFDMQFSARAAAVALDYLGRVEPRRVKPTERAFALLLDPLRSSLAFEWTAAQKTSVAQAVVDVAKRFDSRRDDYIARSDADGYALARQHVRILEQWVELNLPKPATEHWRFSQIRDAAMAANVQWILDRNPGGKMVVWAHNAHVATNGLGSMGAVLRKALSSAMVVFGFAFHQGGFQAVDLGGSGLRNFSLPPAHRDSLDALLASTGHPLLALDLRDAAQDPDAAGWFSRGHDTHSIGALFADKNYQPTEFEIAPSLYDAILFVETTTPARGTPSGMRPPTKRHATPRNLGLELTGDASAPLDWDAPARFGAYDVELTLGSDAPREGKQYATLRKRRTGAGPMGVHMSLAQTVNASAYRGKHLRVRAWVRADVRGPREQASLFVGVRPFAPPSIGTMVRAIESRRWMRAEIQLDVPADAGELSFGLALGSEGEASIDGVEILVD